ncbi:hypothetical protein VTO58DRAFT_106405 [Aureobasidium pullulans]
MILVGNPAASDTPYYTPSQCPVAGTAVAGRVEAPKLFKASPDQATQAPKPYTALSYVPVFRRRRTSY